MARFLLSAERINPTDNTSYLVGKESNNTVAVVTRDHDGLHCMRCSGKRASEGVGQCAHILAVQEREPVKVARRPNGWCQCEGDQLAAGNAVYFSNEHGHGWNCATCGLLLQEG